MSLLSKSMGPPLKLMTPTIKVGGPTFQTSQIGVHICTHRPVKLSVVKVVNDVAPLEARIIHPRIPSVLLSYLCR